MQNNPKPQEIYKHFKDKLYQIITLAEHSETREQMVIYQALYGEFKIYARPLSMFQEKVDREKYPLVSQEYRFELQNQTSQTGEAEIPLNSENTPAEANGIDPLIMEFLGAGTHEERLRILTGLHSRITNDMINTMAVSIDVEIEDGDAEERYEELKNCLLTKKRFERIR